MNAQRHPFAPGAIEAHRRARIPAHQRRALLRWLGRTALLMGTFAALGLLAGLISGVL